MSREDILEKIKEYVKNGNSIKHMLAVEAVMCSLARKFGEDEDRWGIAGLVHDIDMEKVDYIENPEEHGKVAAQMLKEMGFEEDIINTVLAHNEKTGKRRETMMEKAIYASDPLTGLIVASTLVTPDKKIKNLSVESVLKRFKENSFAKGANRNIILSCTDMGIDLEQFISIGLSAMQDISSDLGL